MAALDIHSVLAALAAKRPLFHSEADFQFAFAWQIGALHEVEVRLETHPRPLVNLDVQLDWPDGTHTAIELKYKTRLWVGDVAGEHFALKDQGANDIGGYDFLKDVERVEKFVDAAPGWDGFAVMITNLPTYWNPAVHGRETNADGFRLHEGRTVGGELNWRRVGGTQAQRPKPIRLRDAYTLRWTGYSRVDSSLAGTFRALVVPVSTGARLPE
ncbi:hypothetical protein [Nocardioides sp. YIM 152315]|uniref:hypothetical protein n=1 Tax=Nocardioides sp. YIM 152315 TaxID=3031760 RepID=UPI0023DA35D2|nr:hypothetical protein [Nocardioides sp. YIM 152315]MDF1606270.1 hypothetical protein [Nocardioides sp. YIM 152315]